MDDERSREISRLSHAARQYTTDEERRAFLDTECRGDEALRREVESQLAPRTQTDQFHSIPADARSADWLSLDAASISTRAEGDRTLGNYRVDHLIGRGGMGAVFLAYDTRLHRRVALKVLSGPAGGDAPRSRLLREARNAAALNHPNICTIHEVGDSDGTTFIAMEYVEGRSLRERLDEGPLPLDQAVRFGIQAADALAYAHDHGVIHRDFKAANAVVAETGRLKIVDFGLARREDPMMASATTMGSVVPPGAAAGTPYAMAPEQARGRTLDARTDVWALGVLLYEMVSGAKPFTGASVPELFTSILRDPPTPLPDAVPAGMRTIIARCLEKTPERRYQQASEVRDALEAVQADTAPDRDAWRGRLTRRQWLAAAGAALAGLAVIVSLSVQGIRDRSGAQLPPPTAPIRLAVLPFENLTGDPDQEYFSDGLTEELITQLGRLHPQALSVLARPSVMRYKNRDVPIDQIGRELGVDHVLTGSARREGSRVRINTALIDARDQTQRWAESFDRESAGILGLQSDVARGVARSLALSLLPDEEMRLARVRPVNPEAHEAYLRGLSHWEKLTRDDLDTAMKYFEMALEKDPDYALAYTGIVRVWSGRVQMRFATHYEALASNAMEALDRALELDDTLPEAHFWLAAVFTWRDWDWDAAEPSFERAIDLNPNYAEARAYYSHYLMFMNRPVEAMAQMERARELDPFNPLFHGLHGVLLLMAERSDEALAQFRDALRTAPTSPLALLGVANALFYADRFDEAFAAELAFWKTLGDMQIAQALEQGYGEGGFPAAMRRAGDALATRARAVDIPPLPVARLYFRAGDNDQALEWLERSFEAHDNDMPYVLTMERANGVRDDPRFQALRRRMNLPD